MFPRRDQPDGDIYTTGLRLILPNDASPLGDPEAVKRLRDENVEVLPLPEFREWLAKYGLSSS